MFTGEERVKVDNKGRIFLPARFREILSEDEIGVTSFWDRCLEVYPGSYLKDRLRWLMGLNRADPAIRRFQRYVMSNAQFLRLDAEGRLLIPQRLRESLHIDSEVVIVGVGDHLEIWSALDYESERGSFSPQSVDASKITEELWQKLWHPK